MRYIENVQVHWERTPGSSDPPYEIKPPTGVTNMPVSSWAMSNTMGSGVDHFLDSQVIIPISFDKSLVGKDFKVVLHTFIDTAGYGGPDNEVEWLVLLSASKKGSSVGLPTQFFKYIIPEGPPKSDVMSFELDLGGESLSDIFSLNLRIGRVSVNISNPYPAPIWVYCSHLSISAEFPAKDLSIFRQTPYLVKQI